MIVGRLAWKSKKSSGSISAISSASKASPTVVSAVDAAAAASFQPRKAQTRIGLRSCGTSPSQRSESTLLRLPMAFRGAGGEGAANQGEGHEEGEGGEGQFERPAGDLVRDRNPDQNAAGRERRAHQSLPEPDVAVTVLADRADEGDDHDHQQRGRLALDLAEAEKNRQRRDEQDAA